MKLEFVTNDTAEFIGVEFSVFGNHWTEEKWKAWRKQFVIGDPVPKSKDQTVKSLKAMGLVGLYREVDE